MVFYSNKAAVYFEMKDFDNCIAACDEAIETTKGGGQYDYVKLSKAMARKANALLSQLKFDESISLYQSALLENQDHGIKMQLQKNLGHIMLLLPGTISEKHSNFQLCYVAYSKAKNFYFLSIVRRKLRDLLLTF